MTTHPIKWIILVALCLEIQYVGAVDSSRSLCIACCQPSCGNIIPLMKINEKNCYDSGALAWFDSMINQLTKEKNELLVTPINYSVSNITNQTSKLRSLRVSVVDLLIEYQRLELENLYLLTHDGKPSLQFRNIGLKGFISTFQAINDNLILRMQEAVEDVANLDSQITALTNKEKTHIKVYRKKFHIFRKKVTWFEAMKFCNELHMNMATLRNKEENDAFKAQLDSEGHGEFDIWLGGTMRKDSGIGWFWVPDGQKVKFTDWDVKDDQPDNWHNQEYCISMRKYKHAWHWNDLLCDDQIHIGCESFEES